MQSKQKYINFDTGGMPEKIIASSQYHLKVLENIHNGPQKKEIAMAGAQIVDNYFGLWIDNKARRDPSSFHHVYEWNKTGEKTYRLFECDITYQSDAIINFKLKPSVEPNENGYVFEQKAFVMEYGDPVVIEPVDAEKLVFEIDSNVVFSDSVFIDTPGGENVKGSFENAIRDFMAGESEAALEAVNFGPTILNEIKNNSNKVLAKMSNFGTIDPITESNQTAQLIVNKVGAMANEIR